MPNLVNRLVSEEYRQMFGQAEGLVVASTVGVTVEEMEAIRGELTQGGVRMRMVRNKLARRALAELGYEFPAGVFQGNVCVAFGATEAAIHAAKVLTKPEVRKTGKIKLVGGVLDRAQLGAEDALALADVPDKNTLRAQLLGALSGPARGLVSVLQALPGGLARVLQARVDAQGGEGEAAAAS